MNISPETLKKLLTRLPNLSPTELAKLRLNVVRQIIAGADLVAFKDAIDEHLLSKMQLREGGWTGGGQGIPSFRIKAGQKLAVVYRADTHGKDKGKYGIEVYGETLDEFPRSVDDARAIADCRIRVV